MNIVVLVVVGLLVLLGLVAIVLTFRHWHWASLVAAVFLLSAVVGFLYLSARLAAREHAWQELVHRYEADLARARDALVPGPDGSPQPQPGQQSLVALRAERDRWRRALERVETWHGRIWRKATFRPPPGVGQPGVVELAAAGAGDAAGAPAAAPAAAPTASPLNAGARVFLFDAGEGGRYLGEYIVADARLDPGTGRFVLGVGLAADLDSYDAAILGRVYDNVDVFESLPTDRWLAFHTTPVVPGGDGSLPTPVKRTIEDVEQLLDGVDRRLQEFRDHDQPVPQEQWEAVQADVRAGRAVPGTYWARVTFKADHAFPGGGAAGGKREFVAGETIDRLDLHTVLDPALADKLTIDEIVFRRPLIDPLTLMHGSQAKTKDAGVGAAGLDARRRALRRDARELEASGAQLAATLKQAEDHIAQARDVQGQIAKDLESWGRDVVAATRTADAFERERDRVRAALAASERSIVTLGDDLRQLVGRIAAGIDVVAPPPRSATAPRTDAR